MAIQFLYFDLGGVLLNFSHARMCRQIAQVAGVETESVRHALFDTGLEIGYERGDIGTAEFYERICQKIERRPPLSQLAVAASDIFEVNVATCGVLASLWGAGYRLGLLSNTNELHYNFFADGRYSLIPKPFETLALSFRIGAVKPEAKIYHAAAELAGVAPAEIFFVDDVLGNVEGARDAGFDAVQYVGNSQLVRDLRARGLRFNY